MKTDHFKALLALTILSAPTFAWAADTGELVLADTQGITRLLISGRYLNIEIRSGGNIAALQWHQDAHDPSLSDGQNGLTTLVMPAMEPAWGRNDETLVLRLNDSEQSWRLQLQVPSQWELNVNVMELGDIRIEGQQANVSAWSARGDITLSNQNGSFSITAMDGNALVDLLAAPVESSAITVWNGDLSLALEENLNIDLRILESRRLQTDLNPLLTATPDAQAQGTRYSLNGGGAEITLRNLNGGMAVLNRDTLP
ncbi:MAG: hypothetical protein R3F41_02000 [Gammaproteobacteria bacterium]|nr:hypothetical protein [Pseudomonadales bacterium]